MTEEIIKDLEKRKCKIISFIVETEDNKFQIIGYNKEGVVSHLSPKLNAFDIYEPTKGNIAKPILKYNLK